MIGRLTLGVIMSDEDAQDVHAYAQVGLRVMQEHNPRHRIADGLLALDKLITEMSGHEPRTLVAVVPESLPSIDDLPPMVTVRQAQPYLPWKAERTTRRKIAKGEIPTVGGTRTYMLAREVVRVLSTQRSKSRSKHAEDPRPDRRPDAAA
jgi:hypothetical protein